MHESPSQYYIYTSFHVVVHCTSNLKPITTTILCQWIVEINVAMFHNTSKPKVVGVAVETHRKHLGTPSGPTVVPDELDLPPHPVRVIIYVFSSKFQPKPSFATAAAGWRRNLKRKEKYLPKMRFLKENKSE